MRIRALGAQVLDLLPVAPLAGNLGLSVVGLTYAGRLTIAVRADPDSFPDLEVMAGAMRADWGRLAELPGGADQAPAQAVRRL